MQDLKMLHFQDLYHREHGPKGVAIMDRGDLYDRRYIVYYTRPFVAGTREYLTPNACVKLAFAHKLYKARISTLKSEGYDD